MVRYAAQEGAPASMRCVKKGRPMRVFGVAAALGLAGCVGGVDLSTNAFVGTWDCDGLSVEMTEATLTLGESPRSIAYVETGGNADYGLTATDGARYSVFNTTRRSLTLFAHDDRESFACTRAP